MYRNESVSEYIYIQKILFYDCPSCYIHHFCKRIDNKISIVSYNYSLYSSCPCVTCPSLA